MPARALSILFAFVALGGDDPVLNAPDMEHDGEPIEGKQQEGEAGRAGRGEKGEGDGHGSADQHEKRSHRFVPFIDVTQSGNDAEHNGYGVARFALDRFGVGARPIAVIAGLRLLGQKVSAIRARHLVRLIFRNLGRWCVSVFHVIDSTATKSQRVTASSSKLPESSRVHWKSRAKRAAPRQTDAMTLLRRIVAHTDRYLRVTDFEDSANALNGLQVENSGRVTRIGAAVDASTRVLREAISQKLDLLIVHHGLFWAGLQPVTGVLRGQLRLAFEHDLAIYSAHLPLDAHPKVGNNAQLAAALGLTATKPFLEYKGAPIGLRAKAPGSREQLVHQLEKSLGGPVKVFAFGPKKPGRIGVVTGAAGSEIHRVAGEGIDTFITGEAPHWAAVAAEELELNLLLGGHYATETFGVKALARHLSKKFSVPWKFIDIPTGL